MSATVVLPSMPAKCPLPVRSIPRGTSASIEDQNGKLVAHCVLVQCTKGQAYLIVQQMDAVVAPKAVTLCVPDMDKPFDLKISTISDVHPNRMHMPMYIQVHYNPEQRYPLEHLVDLLAETVLGRYNFELRKNLTIDLFDSAANAAIRDGAGFIVSDRHRFQQISVGAKQARAVLAPTNEVLISLVSDDHSELLKYDASLSNHQRADFLNFLIKECKNVLVAHWSPAKLAADAKEKDKENEKESEGKAEQKGEKEEAVNTVAGYLIASSERVLCLYAENSKIADSLLAAHIDRNNQKGTGYWGR
ncbi:hypothetical protein niasHT_028472 [Heterodera trifolii]|uniref:DUF7596 domain-containing protein n=1 Tax=Heterodera trifolii TaxID=157864 RepID=A0ABD2KPP9_9BILA